MQTIHWIGTGLSSVPGLRRLIENGHNVIVWNRTKEKAVEAVGDLNADIRAFQMNDFVEQLQKDDVAISMLPGDWHVPIAEACLNAGANFVSSSYISTEMRALDEQAKQNGLTFVNEVGLDPGIDHLMAHWLVADYRNAVG
ncbi:MAG: saccharopine dehydrogenase NADP-binding domain-containing protein, partial [Pseudomonadota bacterium]